MVTFFHFCVISFLRRSAEDLEKKFHFSLTQRGAPGIFLFNGEPRSLVGARDEGVASWSLFLPAVAPFGLKSYSLSSVMAHEARRGVTLANQSISDKTQLGSTNLKPDSNNILHYLSFHR